jgi:hypothetical protein
MNLYADKVRDVLANADRYHAAYYQAAIFHGPSLYFHVRALETRKAPDALAHLEYVYATLASWGMHRMGKGGSKMLPFEAFRASVAPLKDKIIQAQGFRADAMQTEHWALLEEIFKGIRMMASGTMLVGNSKVMHHMMPNIVPPIDREYTLRYLRGNTNISNDPEREWRTMQGMIADFFIPVACDPGFGARGAAWMGNSEAWPWDTSAVKVVDNLIIGLRKITGVGQHPS